MTALVRQLSPATLRLAELVWLAGRAALLGAHEIPGFVWLTLHENAVPRGTVVLVVYGADPVEAWRVIDAQRPSDTGVVMLCRRARWYHRMLRRAASVWWRWIVQPLRLRGRRAAR